MSDIFQEVYLILSFWQELNDIWNPPIAYEKNQRRPYFFISMVLISYWRPHFKKNSGCPEGVFFQVLKSANVRVISAN